MPVMSPMYIGIAVISAVLFGGTNTLTTVHYAPWISPPATLVMWFQLRSPELADEFERLMAEDRDIVRGSLDTVSSDPLTMSRSSVMRRSKSSASSGERS